MQRHGCKTVFLGRFVAILRYTVAWIAGLSRMEWWRLLFWNEAGGIAWATAAGLLAYYSGRAAADAIQRHGLYAAAGLAVVLVGGWLLVRRARRRAEAHLGRKLPVVDPGRARALLAAERRRIERALGRVGHEDDSEPADEFDPGNLASDLYQDELDEGLEEDLREQLAAVERAEQRLAAGTYGLSIESGEPIPDERLEALPTAELTADEERTRTQR